MTLAPHHEAHLKNSGLSDEVIKARGYSTVDRRSNADDSQRRLLKRCGFARGLRTVDKHYPGILIPVYGPTGVRTGWVYRPDIPREIEGKPVKYETPRGTPPHIDVHPFHRDTVADPTIPLLVVEGHKKADAITTAARATGTPLAVVAINGVFGWRAKHGVLGEWESIPLKGRHVYVVFDADAATNHLVERAMTRFGGWLASVRAKPEYVVVPKLGEDGKAGADDYLAAGNTLSSLLSLADKNPPVQPTRRLTDAEMAYDLYADVLLPEGFRWCRNLGGWFHWDEVVWRQVDEEMVLDYARRYIIERGEEAVRRGAHHDVITGLRSLQSFGRTRNVVNFTKGIPGVLTDPSELDAHPDLLNCANGPVDLTTGELLDPDPNLLLTKCTGVRYVPGATHDDWTRALEAIPNEDTLRYLHRFCGQSATGYPPGEDLLMLAVGSGANGKNTIFNTVSRALGDYSVHVPDRALITNGQAHPTERMGFRGARFAWLDETPDQGRLDTTALKKVVGVQVMDARLMRRDSVTFDATHTLVVSTNHLPVVTETDHGTWRRLICLLFPLRYVDRPKHDHERPKDLLLRHRLERGGQAQLEAVLAWLVDAAKDWYADDRRLVEPSAEMAAATAGWRQDVDLIASYFAERLVPEHGYHITGRELAADFNNYLSLMNLPTWGQRTVVRRMRDHDRFVEHGIYYTDKVKADGPQHGKRSTLWADDGDSRTTAWVGVRFADGLTKKPGLL